MRMKRAIGKGSQYVDVGEADRTVTMDRKEKGKAKAQCAAVVKVSGDAKVDVDLGMGREDLVGVQGRSWAWAEPAMYRDIANGFYFGLPKKGI